MQRRKRSNKISKEEILEDLLTLVIIELLFE